MPRMNSQYWVSRGLFRPSCSRSCAAASLVARSPRIRKAGSPGIRRTMLKMMIVTPKSTRTIINRRLPIYCTRPILSSFSAVCRGERGRVALRHLPPAGKLLLLLVDLHGLKAIVAQTVNYEARDIVLPGCRGRRIDSPDERRVVLELLLDVVI